MHDLTRVDNAETLQQRKVGSQCKQNKWRARPSASFDLAQGDLCPDMLLATFVLYFSHVRNDIFTKKKNLKEFGFKREFVLVVLIKTTICIQE